MLAIFLVFIKNCLKFECFCVYLIHFFLQAEKLNEDKSFSQDVVKHIDVDMISLHDYSKSKEIETDSLPTLLDDLNKLVDDEIEFVYFTPQEITIFQVTQ